MAGLLLDTHALYWLVSGDEKLSPEALLAIGDSQTERALFVSAISAWELALAARKRRNAPALGEASSKTWFRNAIRALGAKTVPINLRIALNAAELVSRTGHKDPGDCHLMATARSARLTFVTRDETILGLSEAGYLQALRC